MNGNIEKTGTIVLNIIITFFQAGFAVWIASGAKTDKITLGAIAGAGFSAVWNIVLKPLAKNYGFITR